MQCVAWVVGAVLLAGCSADAGEQSQATADIDGSLAADARDELAREAVTVQGPGFAVQLPVDSSWRTVGLNRADATELSGALLSNDPSTSLALVWQQGQRSPTEALGQAFSGLVDRGIEVTPGETVNLDIAGDLDVTAQHVTLTSVIGSTHGLLAVWTCEHPTRTFALVVHDGDEHRHLAVANLVVNGFDCDGT